MGRPRKYATPEESKRAQRAHTNAWKRRRTQEMREVFGAMATEPPITIPPEVLAAQRRVLEWLLRAVAQGRVTANQYFIGEPSSGRRSLSATQIEAMLG